MPSSIEAMTVPGRLPMPPSTQMANTRPIYSRPTDGSTGWMMMRKAPAKAAVAIGKPEGMRLVGVGCGDLARVRVARGGGLAGLVDDEEGPRQGSGGDRDAEGDALDVDRIGGHQ